MKLMPTLPRDERFAAGAAWVDGALVPIDEASVPLLDWGFLRGDATYDVVHVWNGAFFRLEAHLDRFERGLVQLHMTLPLSRAELRATLIDCVRASGLRHAYVAMLVTRGRPSPGSRDPRTCRNRFYAFAVPFVWIASPEAQERGLSVLIARTERIRPEAVDPTVKNYHWLDFTRGLFEAYDRGAETVVLVDRDGHVVEGPGFNIFVVKDGALATPAEGVLEGVTRQTVLQMAAEQGLACAVGPVAAEALRGADEAFATSTAGGVMPITQVDGRPVGTGAPGPITGRLREQYWALHKDARFTTSAFG